jgi:hypothetical protein
LSRFQRCSSTRNSVSVTLSRFDSVSASRSNISPHSAGLLRLSSSKRLRDSP